MKTQTIDGGIYRQMVLLAASKLDANRKLVNDLNVFPIPDGDTGDNMFMTINSGCVSAARTSLANISEVSSAVSSGMLLGARGNSGVILSRIFAGLAKGLSGKDAADLADWKEAARSAVSEAYGAVAVPVEGTMLTVLKDAVTAAAGSDADDFQGYFAALVDESQKSLERTPELLDVLRNAGVVDSGGAGLLYIFQGMKAAVDGETLEGSSAGGTAPEPQSADLDAFTEDSVLEYGYCTEFLLRLQNSKVDVNSFDESVIRHYLEGAGDSLVFFRDGSIIKVHVHTRTPGDILNTCQQWGEYLTIKIENMTLQHHENHMEHLAAPKGPRRAQGIVTVASGDGLVRLFSDMGAQVIEGGQTMNPSTQDFLQAFDMVNAGRIFVLPNNSNIIMTAQQAASIYDKSEVIVLPSRTIGGGYCVLGSVDFASGTAQEIEAQAQTVLEGVVTGMVSKATRTTDQAAEGDFIGFTGKEEILVSSPDRSEAVAGLCGRMGASDYDVILIVKGRDVPESEANELYEKVQAAYRRSEIVLVDGGQPVYDYIIVLE